MMRVLERSCRPVLTPDCVQKAARFVCLQAVSLPVTLSEVIIDQAEQMMSRSCYSLTADFHGTNIMITRGYSVRASCVT